MEPKDGYDVNVGLARSLGQRSCHGLGQFLGQSLGKVGWQAVWPRSNAGYLRLRKQHGRRHVKHVLTAAFLSMLYCIWWAASIATVLAECEHARNRTLLHDQNKWALFSARCVIADASSQLKGDDRDCELKRQLVATKSSVPVAQGGCVVGAAQPNRASGSAQSAIQIYHGEQISEHPGAKVADEGFWAKVKERWASLPLGRQSMKSWQRKHDSVKHSNKR